MQLLRSNAGTIFQRNYLKCLLWHLYDEAAEFELNLLQPILLFLLCFTSRSLFKCLFIELSDPTTHHSQSCSDHLFVPPFFSF